ncbi:pyrroloquinoline quinone biosynthesis protein D [Rhodoligotrophos appendicifer]|nr:pyrroloquinoline quinone biosynthesis peptide chaperone PqqD [Rhodoligotrophos appendicifer]
MSDQSISGDATPRLLRGVRLKYDAIRENWVLLAPERILKPDSIALEILKRCDGKSSLNTIIEELAQQFSCERDMISTDVVEFLLDLSKKRVLEL